MTSSDFNKGCYFLANNSREQQHFYISVCVQIKETVVVVGLTLFVSCFYFGYFILLCHVLIHISCLCLFPTFFPLYLCFPLLILYLLVGLSMFPAFVPLGSLVCP